MGIRTPTIKLLSSSILIALSGIFRIYVISLFLGIVQSILVYLAGFLVIYATYTLDRALECEEDKINRKDLVTARKDIALAICLVSFVTGSLIFFQEGLLLIALLPFTIGYFYSKGIHIGCFRLHLKGKLGVKNITVSFTWGAFISGIAHRWAESLIVLFFIFPFVAFKSFINTVIWDFRDVRGDLVAGVRTLPICIGEKKTRELLLVMHLLIHLWIAIAMILNLINVESTILFTVWIAGIVTIFFYTKPPFENEPKIRKIVRDILVHGEFMLAAFFRELTRV